MGGKGTGRPLYESLWARTFSGSFFCLKLDELYLERSVKDESGGMRSRELRVSITQAQPAHRLKRQQLGEYGGSFGPDPPTEYFE